MVNLSLILEEIDGAYTFSVVGNDGRTYWSSIKKYPTAESAAQNGRRIKEILQEEFVEMELV